MCLDGFRTRRAGVVAIGCIAVALGSSGRLAGQDPPLIPRRVLFSSPERSSPQLSPDGRLLAYLAHDGGVANVWVRTLDRQDDRAVTRERTRPIRRYAWRGDSRHVLYLQDVDGDENWHLLQTDVVTRVTRDLTPLDGVQAQVVALDPCHPNEMLVGLNRRDRRVHDVYRLDLRTGALTLDTENPGDVVQWTADQHLRVRLARATLADGTTELRIRDDAGAPWRVLRREPADEGSSSVLGFSADDRRLWLVSSAGATAARLLEVEVASGTAEVLAADSQFDVSSALLHPTRHTIQAVSIIRERSEWALVDSALAGDFAALRKLDDGTMSVVSRDLADRRWVVQYERAHGPPVYRSYDRVTGFATRIFTAQSALEQYTLAPMEPISFVARDGLTLYGYLTLPVAREPRGLPLVLLVHGGPWERDLWGFNPEVQLLANRGYAVLQVNFRGSAGYGKAYLNAGDREWGGKMQDDLLDAKRWAVAEGYADPSRVCISGASYGGYAALVGLAFTPEEFRCGIDVAGPSNLLSLLRSVPPYWAAFRAVLDRRLGRLEADSALLRGRSPLFRAHRITAPLLIVQGANDPRVPQAESDQIVAAMRQSGKSVEYLVFPDEGHGFARPENHLRFYAAMEVFLAKHLGGRAEPPGEGESVVELMR